MADPGGTSSEQLEAAKQLTEAIKNFASLTEKNNSLLRSQLEITRQISSYSKTVSDTTTTTTQSLNDAAESVDRLNNSSLEDLVSQLDDVNDKAEESRGIFSKIGGLLGKVIKGAALVGAFAIEKFFSILKGIYSIGKTVVSTLFSIVGVIWDLGKALLSIPFKAFDWLVAKAQSMGGGGNEYAQAIQNIKKEYGDLNQIAPKTIMSMARNTASLAEVGIKARRVYGNLGERMKEMLEFSQKLGPLFESFAGELEETGLKIPTLAKGMGLADEQALTVAQRAKTLGIKMQDQFLNIHKMSWTLGKNYGNATKLLNRDVAIAMKDVKRFGGATEAQMMGAAVYARSLGLELDKISGILDAFDTFEGAADVASKLAQTWGVQIDPFALLNEQDPVAIVDAIKQGFANSGKDITQFNRAEKDLLSQLTKLSPEITQQALSLHNQGVALEDVMKDANTASKSFSTLDGALEQLRGSIELIVQSGSMPQFTGFFDAWWQGIQRGIELNPQFRGLFRDIRQGLRFTFYDAKRVFDAFVENFPGVKDMIQGLRELFNPAKIGGLIRGINNEIISFLRNLKEGKVTFSSLMSGITKQFENYLGGAEKGGSRFLEGLGAFGETVAKIAGSIIEWIGTAIADGIKWLTDFIHDPSKYLNPAIAGVEAGAKAIGQGATSLWTPMWEGLQSAWKSILEALSGLAIEIGKQLPLFKEFLELFQDSNRDLPGGEPGAKMSNLRVKILDFWEEMKAEFNSFTESQFFKDMKALFSDLKITLKGVAEAVGALTGAMFLAGLAPARLKGVASILGAGLGFGATKIGLSDVSEDEIKDAGIAVKDMTAKAWEAAKDKTASGAAKLKELGASAVEESEKIAIRIGTEAQNLYGQISEDLKNSNIGEEAKTILLQAAGQMQYFESLMPKLDIDTMQALLEDVKETVRQANTKAQAALKSVGNVATTATAEVGRVVASVAASPSTIAASTPSPPPAPSARGMIPAFDALTSLTFDDVSKSIKYLTDTIGGSSVIKNLVSSLTDANNIISKQGAEASAKNVSSFFDHVSGIATSLGKLQELVHATDAEGTSNFDKIKTNLEKFSTTFEQIVGTNNNSGLGKIISTVGNLVSLLNGANITNDTSERVRLFFDALSGIAESFSTINEKRVLSTDVDTSLQSLEGALNSLKTHITPLFSALTGIETELNKSDGQSRKSIPTKVVEFLKVFNPFVTNFKSIRAGLKEISGLAQPGDTINPAAVSTGITNVTQAIQALTVAGTENPQSALGGALGGIVSPKTGAQKGFEAKSEYANIPDQLKTLKDHLVKIVDHIGDANSPASILGGLTRIGELSAALKPGGDIGKNIASSDFSSVKSLFEAITVGTPGDASSIIEGFTRFRQSLQTSGFDIEIVNIAASLEKFKKLEDSVAKIPKLQTFNQAVESVAKFSGFGGPYSIDGSTVQFDVTVNVRLQTSELEFAVLSDKDSIIVDRVNWAMSKPTESAATVNPSNPTAAHVSR